MTRITNWEMWHLDYFLAFIASLGKSLHLYILGLGLTDVGIDIKSLHRESLQLSPQFLTMVVWFTCSVLFLKWSELLSHSLRHTKLLLIRYIVPVCEYDWLNNSNIRGQWEGLFLPMRGLIIHTLSPGHILSVKRLKAHRRLRDGEDKENRWINRHTQLFIQMCHSSHSFRFPWELCRSSFISVWNSILGILLNVN